LRALYFAWTTIRHERQATDAANHIAQGHVGLVTSRTNAKRAFDCRSGIDPVELAEHVERYETLIAESNALRRMFERCGYETIRWEGRLGPNLLPFEGVGWQCATWIVKRVGAFLAVDSVIEPPSLEPSPDAVVRFAKSLGIKRGSS
jgi:hypothetical protein